jgi:hypothetical protein
LWTKVSHNASFSSEMVQSEGRLEKVNGDLLQGKRVTESNKQEESAVLMQLKPPPDSSDNEPAKTPGSQPNQFH